jgi:pyruvate/2-oxoglutarate dehydrogenase complex dihydrolipoamide acyltransferase (E2) component
MGTPPKKELKMRRLERREIGSFRKVMMAILSASPDPFGAATYVINAEPCIELAASTSAQLDRKITMAHVLNKLLALAIAENPIFNQLILGSNLYQMEEIHIANAILLPGKEQALTYVVYENPHQKSLKEIQQESIMKMVQATKTYAKTKDSLGSRLTALYFKTGLNRLVPEKTTFAVGFKNGLISNIILSNHDYGEPAYFNVLKPVTMNVPLRIHSHGTPLRPLVENGAVTAKRVFSLTVIIDHRIMHGVHGQQFGRSLARIAADPSRYLL